MARGNEKGRVERRVRDLREAFFAARSFHSLDDLNAQLDAWIVRVQRSRTVPSDPDRHHADVIAIEGKSYRLREARGRRQEGEPET